MNNLDGDQAQRRQPVSLRFPGAIKTFPTTRDITSNRELMKALFEALKAQYPHTPIFLNVEGYPPNVCAPRRWLLSLVEDTLDFSVWCRIDDGRWFKEDACNVFDPHGFGIVMERLHEVQNRGPDNLDYEIPS